MNKLIAALLLLFCTLPAVTAKDLPDGQYMELKYFTDCLRDGIKPGQYQTMESIADTYKMLKAEKESLPEGKKIDVKGDKK